VTFEDKSDIDNIVVLELDRPAVDIEPVATPETSAMEAVKSCTASTSFNPAFGPDKVYEFSKDKHGKEKRGFWAPKNDDASPWMAVEFAKPVTFNYVTLFQSLGGAKVKSFEVQYDEGGQWKTLYTGGDLPGKAAVKCRPVTTSKIRLHLHDRNLPTGLHISEFDVKWVGPKG